MNVDNLLHRIRRNTDSVRDMLMAGDPDGALECLREIKEDASENNDDETDDDA